MPLDKKLIKKKLLQAGIETAFPIIGSTAVDAAEGLGIGAENATDAVKKPELQKEPKFLPKPEEKAVAATPNAQPTFHFDSQGNVRAVLPTGEVADFTKGQWMKSISGQNFIPTPEQKTLLDRASEISILAQRQIGDRIKSGEANPTADYQAIFQDLSKKIKDKKEFETFMTALPQFAVEQANKPIEPFQAKEFNIKQALAFGTTGAASAAGPASLLGAAGAKLGVGGAAAGSAALGVGLAGASVAFVGGVLAARSFQRSENIDGAREQVHQSDKTIRNLMALANNPQGIDRFELVEAFEKQWRDIEAAERYLKEMEDKQVWSRNQLRAERIHIQELLNERQNPMRQRFYAAIQSAQAGSQDMSFLKEPQAMENEAS